MSNRFHNKFHSHNHHTKPTDRDGLYPDSAYDPIASREAPFKGEFYAEEDITAAGSLSARFQVTAQEGLFHGDVTVKGNLEVLGTTTQLDTLVYATSAFQIENHGTGPALKVTQFGQQPLAHFIDFEGDDVILDNSGFLGLGTDSPNKKLTVVGDISATRHADPTNYGYGHIFNDGNTTTQGRLTVVNQTHLLSSAFISNNLTVNTRTLFVSAGPSGRGRVGINTEVPSEELTVDGDGLINENLTVGIDLNVSRDTKINRNLYVNTKGLVSLSGTDGNSKVGINTLTPNVELAVRGSLSATGNATFNGGLTADGSFYTKSAAKIDGQTTIGTINPTTNPDTNVKVLVHDSDTVVRFNYPNDVIWDTTAEFLTAKNLTANTLPLYKSRYTLENSPLSLNGSIINIAANLSANGTIKSDGNLTAANVFGTILYSDDSNSREWKSVYTTMRNTSATWEEAAAQAGSGGAFNTIKAVSGTWDSTYTTVKANSGSWNALADGVVFRTGSNMTGPLTINPQGDNYSSTALSLTGDVNLKGTIVIDTNAVAPVMSLSNPTGYGRLEVGGLSGGYIDFKSPFTDDFDIRVAHDQGTSYIATSGDLYLKTGNSLSALQDRAVFKADGKVGVRTGSPTAYLHVSGSTSVVEATPIAILGGVEINTSNQLTSYSGGTRADVTLDLGKVRSTENVGMARLNFWSQNGIQDASIERRPVISGGVTTGDATNGDFRITNFGAGVLYIDAGAGSDSGTMQLWAGQGSTLNPGINGARTGVILSGGFIGFRNEFVTVKGVSGSQVRLTNNNDPTATRPVSSSISFRNSVDIIDAEIVNERRSNGNSVLLFRSTTTGVSSTDRTTTAMTINGSFVGINKNTPAASLDVSGGIISTSGAIRAQQGQPSPNTTTQNAAGYGFADAANTGLFATTSNSVSLYAVGNPGLTLENTGTRKIVIGGGETVDTSGNVYIGTTTTGAGEGGGYGRRHLVIKSSSTSGSGGLLELTDGAGGHGIVYRSNTTGLSSGGSLILDSRMNDSSILLSCKGTGGITFDTGGRVPFPGQSQINGYSTMIVNHQQVNINGGLFVTLVGQAQRVKPANWGGGVTTFDVYSDGGTIGIGAAGTGIPLATINNAGQGAFTNLYSSGNISTPASIYSNYLETKELQVLTTGDYGKLEVGGLSGAYIDLKAPFSDDVDFRISHIKYSGTAESFLESRGNLRINTAPIDSPNQVTRMLFGNNGVISVFTPVIIDSSEGVIGNSNSGAGTRIEVKSSSAPLLSAGSAAYMVFHRPASFAGKFGLDTDNQWKVGGWSYGNTSYRIIHEGLNSINMSGASATFGSTIASSLQSNGTSNLNGNVNINNGVLFVGRQDNVSEGGEIQLAEANSNAAAWHLDVLGTTGTGEPRFRIHRGIIGEALTITSDRRVGIQRIPDAGIILDANGVIRGTQVIANNSGGQVITGFDSTFASTEMVGPRGAYIDLRQLGGTAFATADNDFSLRLRAFDNINEIEAPYRDLLIRSNTSGGANESRITLGSGNKVGIGPAITTPAATLHVGGDVIVASGGIRNNNAATALELYSGASNNKRAILSLNGTGSSNTDGVTITTSNSIIGLTVDNTGKTALGTGGSALARLHIARSSISSSLNNHIYLDGTTNGTYGWFIDTQDFNGEVVPFRISARRNGVNTNHFVITNVEGNVGIGMPSNTYPTSKLHVEGSSRLNGLVQVGRRNTVDEGGYIEIGRASDNQGAFAITVLGTGTSPRTRFITNVGGEVMTILNTNPGNIGIRNTNPTEALDVTGNIKASGNMQSSSSVIGNTLAATGDISSSAGNILATNGFVRAANITTTGYLTAGSISTTGTFAAGSISITGTITVNNIQLNGGNLTTTSQLLTINSSNGKINCTAIECAGEVLTKTINFTNVKETKQNKSVLGDASVSINLGEGSIFEVSSPSLNINSFTLSNLPTGSTSFTLIITQGSTPRTVNWLFVKDNLARTIKWPDGEVPVVTQTANKTDIFVFTTFDSGTTWFGGTVGQNY